MEKCVIMLAFLVVLLTGNIVHGQIFPDAMVPCKDNSDCVNCSCNKLCRAINVRCLFGICRCGCGYCDRKSLEIDN
ncbi:unnamed protein product [Lupinus luteus]|uniref:Uncharacterized protein n=1 Tax=Lupinus luteus TaxID=3873 RepID=A0AAV1WMW6_LUPLU